MRAGETAAAPNPSSKIEVRCDLAELSRKSESSPSFDEASEEAVDDLDLELEFFRRARDFSRSSFSLAIEVLGTIPKTADKESRTRLL
jgi:hypothetical protein